MILFEHALNFFWPEEHHGWWKNCSLHLHAMSFLDVFTFHFDSLPANNKVDLAKYKVFANDNEM